MLQLILDCTKLVPNILPDKRDFLLKTESHARLLCYKLHFKDLNSTVAKRGSVFIGLMTPDGAIWSRYQRAVLMR